MFRRKRADGDRRFGHKPVVPEPVRVAPVPAAPAPAVGGDWSLPLLPSAPYIAFPNSGQTYPPMGGSGGVTINPYTTTTTNWTAVPVNLTATLTTNAVPSVHVSGVIF